MDGTVERVGVGINNIVFIRHSDGLVSSYWHMATANIKVAVGDVVSAGDQIGKMGSVGQSTGIHLHIELDITDVEDRSEYEQYRISDVSLKGETCEAVARELDRRGIPYLLHSGDLDRHDETVSRLGAPLVPLVAACVPEAAPPPNGRVASVELEGGLAPIAGERATLAVTVAGAHPGILRWAPGGGQGARARFGTAAGGQSSTRSLVGCTTTSTMAPARSSVTGMGWPIASAIASRVRSLMPSRKAAG